MADELENVVEETEDTPVSEIPFPEGTAPPVLDDAVRADIQFTLTEAVIQSAGDISEDTIAEMRKGTAKEALEILHSAEYSGLADAFKNGLSAGSGGGGDDEYLFPTIVEHYTEDPEQPPTLEYFSGKSPKMLAVINDSVAVNHDTGETAQHKTITLYEPLKLGDKYLACTYFDTHDMVGQGYLYELDESNYPQNIRFVTDVNVSLEYGGGIPEHTVGPGTPDTSLQYTMIVGENWGETELYNGGISDSDTMDRINRGINAMIRKNSIYDGTCSFKVYSSERCIAWLIKGSDSVTFDDNNKHLTGVNPLFDTVVYVSPWPWGEEGGTD